MSTDREEEIAARLARLIGLAFTDRRAATGSAVLDVVWLHSL